MGATVKLVLVAMEVALPQTSLQPLAQALQRRLQATAQRTGAGTSPLRLQCAMKQTTLMVLAEHAADTEVPSVSALFDQLKQVVLTIAPDYISPELELDKPYCQQVRLYLRARGQSEPAAFLSFAYQLPETSTDLSAALPDESEVGPIESEPANSASHDSDRNGSNHPEVSGTCSLQSADKTAPTAVDSGGEATTTALALFNPDLATVPEPELPPSFGQRFLGQRSLWLAAALGVSVISFGVGMLLVTFPCVLGRCEPIQMAEIMSRKSARSLQQADSNQDLLQIRQTLGQTYQLLGKVPPWSAKHEQAQALLRANQLQTQEVERLLAAEQSARQAQEKVQSLPQSATVWQEVRSLWQRAIGQLEAISAERPSYDLAQKRLVSYREGLTVASQLLHEEQTAQSKIKTAQSAAQKAEARQGLAQTLENWQLVQATWQVAVNHLVQIPSTTTAHAEAQTLLTQYNAKLAEVRDRVSREQAAQTAYAQANQLAKAAQTYEQQNQWSQAVTTWRKALQNARQVPQNTPQFEAAQALVEPYTQALAAAESQLRVAVKLQTAQENLNRVCQGTPKTCSFLVTQEVIRVQFSPLYEQAMRNAFAAGQAGNSGAVGGALNHIDGLRTALQAIANHSGIPVETYSADGSEILWGFNPGG